MEAGLEVLELFGKGIRLLHGPNNDVAGVCEGSELVGVSCEGSVRSGSADSKLSQMPF